MPPSGSMYGGAVALGCLGVAMIWLFFNSLYTSLDFLFGRGETIVLALVALWISGLLTGMAAFASEEEDAALAEIQETD